MISIVRSLIEEYVMIPSFNVIILGTQQTGKTRLFNLIKNFDSLSSYLTTTNPTYIPTVGLNTTKFRSKQARICVWDLGGKRTIRKIWQNYYSEAHGILFFIDSKNEIALQDSLETLKQTLRHNQTLRIPILLLVKSSDDVQQLNRFIQRQQDLFYRDYKIQVFEFPQVGMLSDPDVILKRQQKSIKQLLVWLYQKIVVLQNEVKTYEVGE